MYQEYARLVVYRGFPADSIFRQLCSIIREFASYGADIRRYVPENVAAAIERKYERKERNDG